MTNCARASLAQLRMMHARQQFPETLADNKQPQSAQRRLRVVVPAHRRSIRAVGAATVAVENEEDIALGDRVERTRR